MSDWRKDYVQGSFRGVPFRMASTENDIGRRVELHEFPLRDLPYAEDLGRKARRFTIECYVAGDDYRTGRDKLLDAIEQPGSGTLVHPFLGQKTVTATSNCSFRESNDEGGIARFTLEFVETGKPISAAAKPDSAEHARDVAASHAEDEAAANGDFCTTFSTASAPAFVEMGAAKLVTGAATLSRLAAIPLGGAGAALRAFDAGLHLLPSGALALVRAPLQLAHSILGLVSALGALGHSPARRQVAMLTMMRFGENEKPVIGQTPARNQQRVNQAAFIRLVHVQATAGLVRAIADTKFSSYGEAVAVRSRAADAIDALEIAAADAGHGASARALAAMRVAMVQDVSQRGGSLARVYGFTPVRTEPALVIARRLHDDLGGFQSYATDLIARNNLRHPGFVPGGVALEILGSAHG